MNLVRLTKIQKTVKYKSEFEKDVVEGLRKAQKHISSKYFYDEIGDKIFQEIMNMEEYYLPESETEILQNEAINIANLFPCNKFDIIELGAGDGRKTVYFLEQLIKSNKEITYYPLDISADVLKTNAKNIKAKIPNLDIHQIPGDYFHTLKGLKNCSPKMILFMGSNLGNYKNEAAINFLKLLGTHMQKNDLLLVGVDLRKNPHTILKAYNDAQGITKRFNMNLLARINRELDANLNLEAFDHYPFYDPISGITYSYIVSLENQVVKIGAHQVSFKKNELLHTEVSQKYSLEELDSMKDKSGFESVNHFLDSKKYFSISVFKR